MPFLNFTSSIGSSYSILVNQSYSITNQPPQMSTQTVWIIFSLAAILLLLYSRAASEPTCKDLAGAMSIPLFFISAVQAFNIDVVTSTIYSQGTSAPYLGVIIENHAIYHYDLIGGFLAIGFVISIANAYLLWLDYKRVLNQENPQMDAARMKSRSAAEDARRSRKGNDDDGEQG